MTRRVFRSTSLHSVAVMHQTVRRRPLGTQQLHRLRLLREANDSDVRERHLRRGSGPSPDDHNQTQTVSRTVEAIVQERLQDQEVSTATRLRNTVAAARRGIHTERSARASDTESNIATLRPPKPTRRIATVRRGVNVQPVEVTNATEESEGGHSTVHRRMGKEEAEWIEKQLQYNVRAAILEKELHTAWQSFYAGAGTSTSTVSTIEMNKVLEEMDHSRVQDAQKIRHQLKLLHGKLRDVQMQVETIENGTEFLAELQERIDAMETALAKFHSVRSEQFEEYVFEEKVLIKELEVFQEKMANWEKESIPRLGRGGASSSTSLRSRSAHTSSNSRLQNGRQHDEENGDRCSNQIAEPDDEQGMVQKVRRLNDAIIRSGGLKGGWDSREHGAFTTLLIRCGLTDDVLLRNLKSDEREIHGSNQESHKLELGNNNNNSDYETRVARFLRKCMRKIVTQSESSVRTHFDWYLRHLELVEEKKRVIHEWKVNKEEERRQIIQCGFEANDEGESNENSQLTGGVPHNHAQSLQPNAKSRAKTDRLLEQWRQEKKEKEIEQENHKREMRRRREAKEAQRKQEQLDAKQKILLYKLRKEQEAMLLERTAFAQDGVGEETSPTPKEDFIERSRIAIEHAKAKRLRLQQIEERKKKQVQLPPRPDNNAGEGSPSTPTATLLFNATEASRARDLSKEELRKRARQRARQGAHDDYIPGEKALPDVKVKSFGHIPIQPRAVPSWRKNI